MRTIAIFGFGKTGTIDARDLPPDVEIWTITYAHRVLDLPRIDRLFEIHSYEELSSQHGNEHSPAHWEWLQKVHPFPIYMQVAFPEFPSSVSYPLAEIEARLPVAGVLTSSISYALAMAIYERVDRIEVYGVNMRAARWEWAYQKPGAMYLVGLARGMGIEVYFPESSTFFSYFKYGYERSMMIRQDYLKLLVKEHEDMYAHAFVDLKVADELLKEAANNSGSSAEQKAKLVGLAARRRNAELELAGISGALKLLQSLVSETELFKDHDVTERRVRALIDWEEALSGKE